MDQGFWTIFPDDATCLEWLRNYLYPDGIFCGKCTRITKHHRIVSRRSYCCDHCGHHVHPTAGTIFHRSRTSLTTWFYAIYLVASTPCGISAKQIERETGVTYKTAWRMFKQIRSMLIDGVSPVGGKGSFPPWTKGASAELADRRVKTKPRFPALEVCSRKVGSRRLPART